MTERKKPPPAPAGAARLLVTAGATAATLIGWALLALETRHLTQAPPPHQAAAPGPVDPFPPLPLLVDPRAPAVVAQPTAQLRKVARPPPVPVATTRSSR